MADEAPYAKTGRVILGVDEDVNENRFLRTTTIDGTEHLLVSDPNAGGGGGGGGTEFDDGDAIDTDSQGTLLIGTTGVPGTARVVRCDDDGAVHVADGGNALTVDGTVAVGSIAAGDNNIGNVDVVTLPSLPTGSNEIGDIGTVTAVTGITNDVNIADGGNVISVDDGAGSLTVDDGGTTLSVDDGAGSLTVDASQLDVDDLNAADDVVSIWDAADSTIYSEEITTTGSDQEIIAGASSQAIKVRSITLTNAGSADVLVELKDGATTVMNFYLAKNGGGATHTFQKYWVLTTGTGGDLNAELSASGSVWLNVEYIQN